MAKLKFGVGLWSVGFTADRFIPNGYRPVPAFRKQVEMVGRVKDAEAIQIHYPSDFGDSKPREILKIVKDNGLKFAALNLNIFGDPVFQYGAFTNTDPKIRRRAIDLVKKAIDVTGDLTCPMIDLWPGQDGFDYCFQSDYYWLWESTVGAIRELCTYAGPKLKVSYEYKLKEPRMYMFISNAGKALALCNAVEHKNFGITLDFGHALLARENPAEAMCLLAGAGRLQNVHFNDAYGEFDDDLIAGTVNLWKTVEYIWYLKQSGYKGYLTLDMFPFREDPVEAAALSIRMAKSMEKIADRLDKTTIRKYQKSKDVTGLFEYLRRETLG
jgi:xylose isomerase